MIQIKSKKYTNRVKYNLRVKLSFSLNKENWSLKFDLDLDFYN